MWRWLAFASTALAAGCSESLGPRSSDDTAPIRTDRTSYVSAYLAGAGSHRRYGFDLIARYTNPTDRDVYLGRCSPMSPAPMYGIRGVGIASAYSPAWGCVGHDQPFLVEAGGTREDTLRISGPWEWSSEGAAYGELTGVFELVYVVRFCPGECLDEAPEWLGVSNQFSVEVR